ncbi:MAG: hypothetical protein IKR11_02450 [Solobacterium sp.]|nr:hypothetical protein [Solobacterium sp.]
MKYLNSIVSDQQVKNIKEWKWLIVLSALSLLFGFHAFLDIAVIIAMIICLLLMDIEQLFFSFVLLYFFEEILCLENIYGISIVVMTPIIALRLLWHMYKNRIIPKKKEFVIFGFTCFSGVMSILSHNFGKATLVVIMTITVALLFKVILQKQSNYIRILDGLAITIAIASTGTVLYGFLHNNYLNENRGDRFILRFNGAYEPNYTALFCNLGILASFSYRKKMGYFWSAYLILINLIGLLLTRSTTGLGVFVILLFIITIRNINYIKRNLKIFLKGQDRFNTLINAFIFVLILLELAAIVFIFEYKTGFISGKLLMIIERVRSGNISSASSGRLPIIRAFLKSLNEENILIKLFGNAPQSLKVYSKYFADYKYAHNTYIDLIYSFGYIGGSVIFLLSVFKTVKGYFLNKKFKRKERKEFLLFSRLIIFISGFMLSLHCEVITIILFLL